MSASASKDNKLTTDDIRTLMEELAKVISKWYWIGIQLGIPTDKLDSLKQTGTDCKAFLCKVLVEWIKKGKATWEALIEALRSETVGEKALADQLRKDYCMIDLVIEVEDTQDSTVSVSANTSDMVEVHGKQTNDNRQKQTNGKRLVRKVPQRFHKDDFVQTQKAERFCVKCKQVPLTPQRSSCCNSIYCGICQTKATESCVKCKQKQISFKKDQDLTSKISKVKIKCPNRSKGCIWKEEVYKLKNHLPQCIATKEGKQAKQEAQKSKKIEKGESSTKPQGKEKDPSSKKPKKGRKLGHTSWLPPLNLIMPDVLSYKNSGDFWMSDSFYSHPLGYKISLAVKVEDGSGDKSTKVKLALMSSEGKQNKHLDFPCFGIANVTILNPENNTNHEEVDILFMLQNEDPHNYPDLSEETEIPLDFIQKECLFFRISQLEMDAMSYKLWLLDPKQVLH